MSGSITLPALVIPDDKIITSFIDKGENPSVTVPLGIFTFFPGEQGADLGVKYAEDRYEIFGTKEYSVRCPEYYHYNNELQTCSPNNLLSITNITFWDFLASSRVTVLANIETFLKADGTYKETRLNGNIQDIAATLTPALGNPEIDNPEIDILSIRLSYNSISNELTALAVITTLRYHTDIQVIPNNDADTATSLIMTITNFNELVHNPEDKTNIQLLDHLYFLGISSSIVSSLYSRKAFNRNNFDAGYYSVPYGMPANHDLYTLRYQHI